MTDGFDNFLAAVGGLGKAAGIEGDGPGGLNALQRASLDPDASAAYSKQSAISQLANDPSFQALPPAAQATAVAQITGDPAMLQHATALSQLSKIDMSNPRAAVQQGVQTGQIPLEAGITAMTSPNMGFSALSQLNNPPSATTPAPAAAIPSGSPPVAGTGASPAPAVTPAASDGIDRNYLNSAKTLFPAAGIMAENMINGVFTPETGKGENDPIYNAALQIAQRADPRFTPQSLIGRPAMVKNAASGDMYKLGTSLNTGMAHLYDLHELAPMTGNAPNSSPALNWIGGKETDAFGLPGAQGRSRYSATLKTAAPEIAKYLGGGAATDTGTEEAQSNFGESQPQDTIQQNARDLGAKMMAKGGSLQGEYDGTMGGAASVKVVQPMTQALYADMQGLPLTAQQQALVNQHRQESNLAPKAWKTTAPDGSEGKQMPPPAAAPAKAAAPAVTPEMARAELARRQAARGGK